LRFRLADPDRRYVAVHLRSDLPLDDDAAAFARHDGEWRLEIAPPPVARFEYELEVEHDDGSTARLGETLLLAGYVPPAWLDEQGVPGRVEELEIRGRGLGADVPVRIWSPDTDAPLPLLVAHDGPDYERRAALTRFAATHIRSGALPPHRVALLAAPERDEWYSASARYAGALVRDVIPGIREHVAVRGPVVGMGASLGALAMLHAQRRHPGTFGALFLQSGSFFVPRFDRHESGFGRYSRIVRFVRATLRAGVEPHVVMTCGAAEENIHNNRLTARALHAELHEVPDLHNFTAWRDAFDPHLARLLARTWRRPPT
jgi:enterochelin esterase family protein